MLTDFRSLNPQLKLLTVCLISCFSIALGACSSFSSLADSHQSDSNPLESSGPSGTSKTTATKPITPVMKFKSSWGDSFKKICDQFYPGTIQAGIRRSCYFGGFFIERYASSPAEVAQTACRIQYGEEPTETYACLIGTRISAELAKSITPEEPTSLANLQKCSEVYSVRTDLDSYLLESCLTGIHARYFIPEKDGVETCRNISPEPSFIGPCAVGVSLNNLPNTTEQTSLSRTHRALCEKYFDHMKFHQGYRACLNAMAVNLDKNTNISLETIRNRCNQLVSDSGNDHERGACIVGAALIESSRNPAQFKQGTAIFDKCGVQHISYDDRDVLGCLAAGSFLLMSNANGAGKLCQEVFRDRKSLARTGCLNSIPLLLKAEPSPEQPASSKVN